MCSTETFFFGKKISTLSLSLSVMNKQVVMCENLFSLQKYLYSLSLSLSKISVWVVNWQKIEFRGEIRRDWNYYLNNAPHTLVNAHHHRVTTMRVYNETLLI